MFYRFPPELPPSQSMSDADGVSTSHPACNLRYRDSYLSAQRRNDRCRFFNHMTFAPFITEDISVLQSMAQVTPKFRKQKSFKQTEICVLYHTYHANFQKYYNSHTTSPKTNSLNPFFLISCFYCSFRVGLCLVLTWRRVKVF